MSTVLSSARFSALEVVDVARFDNEIVFTDLIMSGMNISILATELVSIGSTGTATDTGIALTAANDINMVVTGAGSLINVAVGDSAATNNGTFTLGHLDAGVMIPAFRYAYNGTSEVDQLGLFAAAPVAQQTSAVVAGAFVAGSGTSVNDDSTFSGYTVGQVVAALKAYGLLA
jgi:hypothetical protein